MGHAKSSPRRRYALRALVAPLFLFVGQALFAQSPAAHLPEGLLPIRAPAYPLVTHDPYFSIWSFDDLLTRTWTRHWSGSTQALSSMVRIDGKAFRLMGLAPETIPPFPQESVHVTPTRTIYSFSDGRIDLKLIFFSPLFADRLDILARPASYIIWQVRSRDGKEHDISLYFDNSAELVVSRADDQVVWSRSDFPGGTLLAIGSVAQPILKHSGDRITIDWGYLYQAVGADGAVRQAATGHKRARDGFAFSGRIPHEDDLRMPRAANDDWPVLATQLPLGAVGDAWQERHVVLAYDDIYAVEYMHQRLRAYWRTDTTGPVEMIHEAQSQFTGLVQAGVAYDEELWADLVRMGGERFAAVAALVYRQTMAAHKLVRGPHGQPYFFGKENSSNGCMATVDVTYPTAPFFLLLQPDLLKAMLDPVMDYVASGRFKFPFAPHDLGTYPLANGQVYGGGESSAQDQMPVEESGNMLILAAAIARADGNASWAKAHWPLLTQWAGYLREQGVDPANQLSTDDFTGHLAHNVNLSAKATIALGAYAQLAAMLGENGAAQSFRATALDFAAKWIAMADGGDHFRLAFDRPDTWSQKYNLIWDRILALDLFPAKAMAKEVAYYHSKLGRYGLPLDHRASYTIQTWNVWSAMLTGVPEDFAVLLDPMFGFASESPDRVPLSDWIDTATGRVSGFQARSVLGGLYMPLLTDPDIYQRWHQRALQSIR